MRRRTTVAAVGLILGTAVVAWLSFGKGLGLSAGGAVLAVAGSPGLIEMIGRWIVVAGGGSLVLGVVVLLAHQYIRWEAYRPAIHLAAVLLGFVAASRGCSVPSGWVVRGTA